MNFDAMQIYSSTYNDALNKKFELAKDVVKTTTIEYSQSSSLHGIQYIFESGHNLFASRIIWMIVVVIFAVLGIVWSVEV